MYFSGFNFFLSGTEAYNSVSSKPTGSMSIFYVFIEFVSKEG